MADMKLLAICVVSHERPGFLESQMRSLSNLSKYSDDVTLYLFDNSLRESEAVGLLAMKYHAIPLMTPGATQADNFRKIRDIEPHSYYMLVHDDDITVVLEGSSFLSRLRQNKGKRVLHYVPAITVNDTSLSVNPSCAKLIKEPPLGNSISPWVVPAFSSWIYPHSSQFFHCFQSFFIHIPLGKYSDVLFIDRLVRCLYRFDDFAFDRISDLCLVLRAHSGRDSFLVDYCLRARLVWSLTYKNLASRIYVFLVDLIFLRASWLKNSFRALLRG